MIIHRCGQDGRHSDAVYRRRHAGSAPETATVGCLGGEPVRHPRFVVGRRSGLKRHCPKLTVFRASANRSATFLTRFKQIVREGVAGVKPVKDQRPDSCRPATGLTRRRLVSTLEQSPESRRYGCDPSYFARCPRRLPRDTEPTEGFVRATVSGRCESSGRHGVPDATRREPWLRASGPSSRTTGAEPASMVFGCGCALGQGGQLCPTGVAKGAAPLLPDPFLVTQRCFPRTTA
jgi:hypothetical protein